MSKDESTEGRKLSKQTNNFYIVWKSTNKTGCITAPDTIWGTMTRMPVTSATITFVSVLCHTYVWQKRHMNRIQNTWW